MKIKYNTITKINGLNVKDIDTNDGMDHYVNIINGAVQYQTIEAGADPEKIENWEEDKLENWPELELETDVTNKKLYKCNFTNGYFMFWSTDEMKEEDAISEAEKINSPTATHICSIEQFIFDEN